MTTSQGTTPGSGQGEHLDFVNVVEIEEREDGTYVFAERGDAERFAAAVDHDPDGEEAVVEFRRAFVDEQALNVGAAAERLIAAERGDALEDVFGPALAEDVREGLPLAAALQGLRELGEGDSHAAALLRRWIELDERTAAGGANGTGQPQASHTASSPAADAAPAYTVLGCRGRGGIPYLTTVHTSEGPEAALDLAHEDFEEDRPNDQEVELEVVAIFHGEPELVDFDAPGPGGAKGGAPR